MPLFLRRVIFYLLLAFFLIVAPLILGYTAGYRYSFKQRRIVKIGALSITTNPPDTQIILNGNDSGRRTPALINDLEPGSYQIVLEREGYYPWQKNLSVVSEQTTFAHNVLLFKRASPILSGGLRIKPARASTIPQSLKSLRVFYETKLNKVVVIDNEQTRRIAELGGTQAVWRKGAAPLLFSFNPHEVWQFDPNGHRSKLVTRLLEEINLVIPLPNYDALLLVLEDRVRGIELDIRDRQNSWDLATFDSIKNAALAEDGKTLLIEGAREGKAGMWELKLY